MDTFSLKLDTFSSQNLKVRDVFIFYNVYLKLINPLFSHTLSKLTIIMKTSMTTCLLVLFW